MRPLLRTRRRTWPLALLALATFAAMHVGWNRATADVAPRSTFPGASEGRTRWTGDGNVPLSVHGDVDAAGLVVLGDSRVFYGIDRHYFRGLGLGEAAVVWYGGGDLRKLLRAARDFECRRLVVAISALSITGAENRLLLELVRERPPVYDAEGATRRDVVEWIPEERAHLVAEGYTSEAVDILLEKLRRDHARERADLSGSTATIDRRLTIGLNTYRYPLIYTASTRYWHSSWFHAPDPKADSGRYRYLLEGKRNHREKHAIRQVTRLLRELAEDREIACVRLPIAPNLREIEDESVDPETVARMVQDAGLPYRDFGLSDQTGDGSHLMYPAARRFDRELARWLQEDVGWE